MGKSADASAAFPFAATIALSLNGVDFAASRVSYAYLPPPSLSGLSPLSGPSLGGTEVTLSGLALAAPLGVACAFEAAIVVATLTSPTSMRCVSPSLGHAAPTAHGGVAYELTELPTRGNASLLHSAIRLTAVGEPAAGAKAGGKFRLRAGP